jgi:hypothetical protein
MLNQDSKFRRLRRRPSMSMVVACVALFMSLGGVGYAAVALPASSVGTTQLKNLSVTNSKIGVASVGYRKIQPGAVGTVRVDKNDVQLRLKSTCAAGQSITAVDVNGKVTCASTGTSENNTAAASAVTVGTTATQVTNLALPGAAAYLVQGNPYVTVTPSTNSTATDQHVVVTCTLAAGPSTTAVATRSVSFDLPPVADTPAPQVQTASIPLTAAAPTNANASTASVSCTNTVTATSGAGAGNAATNPATVTVQAPIYALQTASSTTAAPTTTTTTTTTTTPAA